MMFKKTLLSLAALVCFLTLAAQSPQLFNFQGVARNAAGQAYASANVNLRISIIRDGSSGIIDYAETHQVATSPNGVFDIRIGSGQVINGSIAQLDWGNHAYFLKVEMDPTGGTNYAHMGTNQLLSVPYAMYAGESGSAQPQSLVYNEDTRELSISNGNTIVLPSGGGEPGPQGERGEQGPIGMTGPQGPQGERGEQGPMGPAGPQGEAGTGIQLLGTVATVAELPTNAEAGDLYIVESNGNGYAWDGSSWNDVGQIQGPQGERGEAGPQGPIGMTGPQGPQGERGEQGLTGPAGPQGERGETGPQGPIGMTGPQGLQGERGEQGPVGPAGPQGEAGTGIQLLGSVPTVADLPANAEAGDLYIVESNGNGYAWDGSSWNDVGQIQGPQGERGEAGPQGPIGMTGPQGPQGERGEQGLTGPAGPQGERGETGPQGPIGMTGPQGLQGERGEQGPVGPAGPQGEAGTGIQLLGSVPTVADLPANAEAGDLYIVESNGNGYAWDGSSWNDVGQIQGPQGERGEQGLRGPAGPQGERGEAGPQGPIGMTGPQGERGEQGLMGPAGPQGERGEQGLPGPAGPQGERGEVGPQGPIGMTGPQGPQGERGEQGLPGPAGPQGERGEAGLQGPIGMTGPQGPQGERGEQGLPGPAGPQGERGEAGPQGPIGMTGPQGPQGERGPAGMYTAGAGITISGDQISATDNSTTNELQTLSLNGNNLQISMGNSVDLSGLGGSSKWTTAIGSDIYYNSGEVGIGTTDPEAPLHVDGGNLSVPVVKLQGENPWIGYYDNLGALKGNLWYDMPSQELVLTNNDASGKIQFNLDYDYKMTIDSDGEVGIGTTDPEAPLHVDGGNLSVPVVKLQGENPWIGYYDDLGALKGNLWYDMPSQELVLTNNDANGKIQFNVDYDYKMTIDSDGNVGIGTTDPGDKLHLVGDFTIDDSSPSVQFFDGNDWHGYLYSDGTDMVMGNTHNSSVLLQTNAVTRGEFNSEGLTINGNGGSLELKNTFTTGPLISAEGGTEDLRIATSGVAISTSGAVNSGDYIMRLVEPSIYGLNLYHGTTENNWEIYADGSGDLQLWSNGVYRGLFDGTTGAYSTVSDQKLKHNIRNLENVLNDVLSLQAARYAYVDNNPTQKESIGFLAQEIAAVFPELVSHTQNERLAEGVLTVDYSGFGVLAIKAIQEQQELIEAQTKVLTQQEERIASLEARMAKLEALLSPKK